MCDDECDGLRNFHEVKILSGFLMFFLEKYKNNARPNLPHRRRVTLY